tara:strand:+ start:11639 stop:11854 length:216 start_codon:yes stop_codon:yes gene_type:complete
MSYENIEYRDAAGDYGYLVYLDDKSKSIGFIAPSFDRTTWKCLPEGPDDCWAGPFQTRDEAGEWLVNYENK